MELRSIIMIPTLAVRFSREEREREREREEGRDGGMERLS